MNIDGYHTELSFEGFQRLVSDLWSKGSTLQEAYELGEIEHERVFFKRRYSSFESFKTNRYKFLKKVTHGLPVGRK